MLMQKIRIHGAEFSYLCAGEGPVVMLLHGFPDIADTWDQQIPALAAARYKVIAPYLRGYAPSEAPATQFFDKASLIQDIAALIKAVSPDAPVYFVGQDWGAIMGYALCAAYPELVRAAVLMAVPHPTRVAESLLIPKHIHRSFHWWFFQQAGLAEQALAANDFAMIDYLWSYWTHEGFDDAAHIQKIKHTFKQAGVVDATLAYYRALFNPAKADPQLESVRQKMNRLISVPTLALCGADDLRAELMMDQAPFFSDRYQFALIPEAGHFPHREQPALVTAQIVDWFAAL